jgi:transcriptional regulator with XRE-family HTH domain
MTDEDLPVLPGFREMALRERQRRELVADLVARRRAAGLSQAEVADRMGTSQPAVARVEAGAVDVRLSTLERYAAAVGRRLELHLGPPADDQARTGAARSREIRPGEIRRGEIRNGEVRNEEA